MTDVDEFLAHNGVKGMKWGRHLKQHSNYSDNQAKRDKQVYGSGGAKRINKQLHNGSSISVARGDEKTRRDSVMAKNKYVRQGGKVAGAAVGVVAANVGLSAVAKATATSAGHNVVSKMIGGNNAALLNMALNHPAVRIAASAGAAKVGTMFAGDIAVSANMRAHGYNPNRT